MTKKTLIISVAMAALLSMAAMAYAGPGYGRGGCGGPGYGYGNAPVDQLTPEKQAAVDKIMEKFQQKQLQLRDKASAAHIKLEALSNSGNVDEGRIDSLVAELSKIRTQMWENRTAMAKEIEAETGIQFQGRRGPGYGPGYCAGYGNGGGRGYHGYGHDGGRGHGMGRW